MWVNLLHFIGLTNVSDNQIKLFLAKCKDGQLLTILRTGGLSMGDKERKSQSMRAVPIWLLVTIVLAFASGAVFGLILKNLILTSDNTLPTTSIISFTFTVFVGTSSIILAIIAIILSRSTEANIKKRDEGAKILNDVFYKITKVLGNIQGSTGATEKRLEDIISGRTSVIVQEVFERSFPKGETTLSSKVKDRLKKSLADSLKEELIPTINRRLSEMEAHQNKENEAR